MEQQEYKSKNKEVNVQFELRELRDFINVISNIETKNNLILEMIYDYYKNKEIHNNKEKNWITIMNKSIWEKYYNEILENLKPYKIISNDVNVKIPSSINGNGRRYFRSHFVINSDDFLKLKDKIIKNCKWYIIIDWKIKPEIRFYCDVTEGKYHSYNNMTDFEKTKAEERKKLILKFQEQLKLKTKTNFVKKCDAKVNAMGIIKVIMNEKCKPKDISDNIINMKKFIIDVLKQYKK